jgi:DNA-directed RNA polymerase subunit RPC12/RpoP
MTVQKCADCDSEMELGFLPDLSHGGVHQTKWHKGEAEDSRFLGRKTGVKVDQRELVPITAYRCSNCGLLKFYANAPAEE